MLQPPDSGLRLSVKEHNCDLDVLCDWIEASLLFNDEEVSSIDVIDILLEEEIYTEQDFAQAQIEQVWSVIDARQAWLGTSRTVQVVGDRLVRALDWKVVPAHSFCLFVALRRSMRRWSDALGGDYIEQGRLFERITEESLRTQGWSVHRTGWSALQQTSSFVEAVAQLADAIDEPAFATGLVVSQAKDEGLDLVCFRRFSDGQGGYPLFLIQCASGANWEKKLRTPSTRLWSQLIQFSGPYACGIAIPFAFTDVEEFRTNRVRSHGLFLDRFRILCAGSDSVGWEPPQLKDEIVQWLDPGVTLLAEHAL